MPPIVTVLNRSSGVTRELTPAQSNRFFDNRDPREWELFENGPTIRAIVRLRYQSGETTCESVELPGDTRIALIQSAAHSALREIHDMDAARIEGITFHSATMAS